MIGRRPKDPLSDIKPVTKERKAYTINFSIGSDELKEHAYKILAFFHGVSLGFYEIKGAVEFCTSEEIQINEDCTMGGSWHSRQSIVLYNKLAEEQNRFWEALRQMSGTYSQQNKKGYSAAADKAQETLGRLFQEFDARTKLAEAADPRIREAILTLSKTPRSKRQEKRNFDESKALLSKALKDRPLLVRRLKAYETQRYQYVGEWIKLFNLVYTTIK